MQHNAKFLLGQAERCRRLAAQLTDRELARTLLDLGEDYARRARGSGQCAAGEERQEAQNTRLPTETAH